MLQFGMEMWETAGGEAVYMAVNTGRSPQGFGKQW